MAPVDPAVLERVRPAPVRDPGRLDALEDRVELVLAHLERVVVPVEVLPGAAAVVEVIVYVVLYDVPA